ncbi:hypothetical protein SAMN05192584_1216 [Streptomyces pini]|uniref:Uncharacterized protein n=1 Tax=Streptomyces pini TaxID=1520580 RepID=A0A1I4IK01_9ACTN|nr:hypothetical protein SAMN05192584_1216 [Streptomyces pini]
MDAAGRGAAIRRARTADGAADGAGEATGRPARKGLNVPRAGPHPVIATPVATQDGFRTPTRPTRYPAHPAPQPSAGQLRRSRAPDSPRRRKIPAAPRTRSRPHRARRTDHSVLPAQTGRMRKPRGKRPPRTPGGNFLMSRPLKSPRKEANYPVKISPLFRETLFREARGRTEWRTGGAHESLGRGNQHTARTGISDTAPGDVQCDSGPRSCSAHSEPRLSHCRPRDSSGGRHRHRCASGDPAVACPFRPRGGGRAQPRVSSRRLCGHGLSPGPGRVRRSPRPTGRGRRPSGRRPLRPAVPSARFRRSR